MTAFLDLSVPVDGSTLGPPAAGSPPVVFETAFRGPGHWQSSRVAALLHTGSHVDARSPDLTEDAAEWIAVRHPSAVVLDIFEEESAVRPDFTSEEFVVHRTLLGRGIPLVEQATNVGAVGTSRFTLWAPFMRFVGVEAAPCRILAVAP